MSWQAIVAALLGCFLGCPFLLNGQASPSTVTPAAGPTRAERHCPEQAYLSPTRYTNEFFGFAFDLPVDAHVEPISAAGRRRRTDSTAAIGRPSSADAAVSIVAFPPQGQQTVDAKILLRKALDQELFRGVEELRGLTKTTLAGHEFYFYETRRGIERHMLAAANLDGYAVIVELGAHNEKMVKELEFVLPAHRVFRACAGSPIHYGGCPGV